MALSQAEREILAEIIRLVRGVMEDDLARRSGRASASAFTIREAR